MQKKSIQQAGGRGTGVRKVRIDAKGMAVEGYRRIRKRYWYAE